jgi:hypothetical protein
VVTRPWLAWGVAALLIAGLIREAWFIPLPESFMPLFFPAVFALLLLGGWFVILFSRMSRD